MIIGTLKNAAWISGTLALVWLFLGAPSSSAMKQFWHDVKDSQLPPNMMTQIGSDGAVVLTADMEYVASRIVRPGNIQNVPGRFHAGQHLCTNGPSGGGDYGVLLFSLPHGFVTTGSNTPGLFVPDTSANRCGRIASTNSAIDPHSPSVQANKRLGQLIPAHPIKFSIAWVGALFAAGLWYGRRKGKEDYKPRTPLPADLAGANFPGFVVRDGDFEQEGDEFYRVNPDGLRVNLKTWHCDKQTGEFCVIERKVKGSVIFDPSTHSERFIRYTPTTFETVVKWAACLSSGVLAVWLGVLAIQWSVEGEKSGSSNSLLFAVLFAFAMVAGIVWLTTNRAEKRIGPKPLAREVPEFGHQQPHGAATDEGTI